MSITTLPTDSNDRKNYALFRGCFRYFPAALAGVAKISKLGNDKHNPGQEMHHDRNKSGDHGDCILRHLMDVDDLLSARSRGESVAKETILEEVSSMVWRALALSQELHEQFDFPLAPGATKQVDTPIIVPEAPEVPNLHNLVRFQVGDPVKHIDNDVEVIVQGTYFDANLKPFLFVKDSDNKIFAVDPMFYRGIYAEPQTGSDS